MSKNCFKDTINVLKACKDYVHTIHIKKALWHELSKEKGFANLTSFLKAIKKEGISNIHRIIIY